MVDALSGPVSGGGPARMTYSTNGGASATVDGVAQTQTWFDGGVIPSLVWMKLLFGEIVLQFGVEPFSGTGTYTSLPYFLYIDPSLYVPGVTGVYTTVAYPPAPDPPLPQFTVIELTPTADVLAMVAELSAHLVWYSPDVSEPPATLEVTSLTLSLPSGAAATDDEATDFDTYATGQFARVAAEHGLQLDASAVRRRTDP